ncbi:hypothetical protein BDR26DRAFT_248790 [Obelidium mucronatum]|nr:hypothetical protein BDR26DRAFT_248790 [Obelidium mucronatum]
MAFLLVGKKSIIFKDQMVIASADCQVLHQQFPSLQSSIGTVSSNCTAGDGIFFKGNVDGNVTAISFPSQDLTGALPDLSQLGNLTYIDLSNNQYIGHIPASWNRFGSLNYLNLQGNYLNGSVPNSWTGQSDNYAWDSFPGNNYYYNVAQNPDGRVQLFFPRSTQGLDVISQVTPNSFAWTQRDAHVFGNQTRIVEIATAKRANNQTEILTVIGERRYMNFFNGGASFVYPQMGVNSLDYQNDSTTPGTSGLGEWITGVTSATDSLGRIHWFGVDAERENGKVHESVQSAPNSDTWSLWTVVPGSEQHVEAISAVINDNGMIELFACNTLSGAGVKKLVQTSASTWSSTWTTVATYSALKTFQAIKDTNVWATPVSSFQAIFDNQNRLYVFVTQNRVLKYKMRHSNGTWSDLVEVTGSDLNYLKVILRSDGLWQIFGRYYSTLKYVSPSSM